jgi:hypothetical protein
MILLVSTGIMPVFDDVGGAAVTALEGVSNHRSEEGLPQKRAYQHAL